MVQGRHPFYSGGGVWPAPTAPAWLCISFVKVVSWSSESCAGRYESSAAELHGPAIITALHQKQDMLAGRPRHASQLCLFIFRL